LKIYALEKIYGGLERELIYVGTDERELDKLSITELSAGVVLEVTTWENGIKIDEVVIEPD